MGYSSEIGKVLDSAQEGLKDVQNTLWKAWKVDSYPHFMAIEAVLEK